LTNPNHAVFVKLVYAAPKDARLQNQAHENFTWERVAEMTSAIYAEIL
jgi:hypothetical protein